MEEELYQSAADLLSMGQQSMAVEEWTTQERISSILLASDCHCGLITVRITYLIVRMGPKCV